MVFSTPAFAQPSFELELLTPTELRVAPGQSVDHALRIRNSGTATGAVRLVGYLSLRNRFSDAPYTFGPSSNPRCGAMPGVVGDFIDLTTDSLAPGETLECTWQLQRPAQSDFDTFLTWVGGASPVGTPLTVIGTLTDTALATRTLSFDVDAQGIGRATIELSVHNRGRLALAAVGVGSCYKGDVPVLVEDSLGPGGCGTMNWSPPCFTGGGFGFTIPPLKPGQDHRCIFKARTRIAYTQPTGWDIATDWEQRATNGHYLLDTNQDNNRAEFAVGPAGIPDEPVALDAFDRGSRLLLSTLLSLIAILAIARRRARPS
ncbi:MAG: hypothetical protein ABI650_05850 [Dokdonella sp.]